VEQEEDSEGVRQLEDSVGVRQEYLEGVWDRRTRRVQGRQEDKGSDGAGQEQHGDLDGLDQVDHSGFIDDEGGEGDGTVVGSVSKHHWFRRTRCHPSYSTSY
jgi:hypothetical protein